MISDWNSLHDPFNLIAQTWESFRVYFVNRIDSFCLEFSTHLDVQATDGWTQRLKALIMHEMQPERVYLAEEFFRIADDILRKLYWVSTPDRFIVPSHRHVAFVSNGTDDEQTTLTHSCVADELLQQCCSALDAYLKQSVNSMQVNTSGLMSILTILSQTQHNNKKSRDLYLMYEFMFNVIYDQQKPPKQYEGLLYYVHKSLFNAVKCDKTETVCC